ncbi:unnamed protein product, partial [Rotaria sp. Silwood2]
MKLIEDYQDELICKKQKLNEHEKEFEDILSTNDEAMLLKMEKALTDSINKIAEDLKKLKLPITVEHNVNGIDELQKAVGDVLKHVSIMQSQDTPKVESPAPQSKESHLPHADPQLVKLFKSVNDQSTTVTDPEIITYIRE